MDIGDDLALSTDQTEKILQFQDLTGIQDMSICREVLQRHQWDLEVAIQEQLNIREGRPSVFAWEARSSPMAVREHDAVQVFPSPAGDGPGGIRNFLSYIVDFFVSLAYDTLTSIFNIVVGIVRGNDRNIVTDPLRDVMTFIEFYNIKYGVEHPVFYQGTYSQALSDAKQELRFLLVYLHCEEASDTQEFCRILADPTVIEFVNTNALMWACNIASGEGWRVGQSLSAPRRRPLLCILAVREHRMTLLGRVEGACPAGLLVQRLSQVMAENEGHLLHARQERMERSMTATLRAQQDAAYEESLAADQRKEREKQRKREEEEARLQSQLDEEQREIQRKEEIALARLSCAESLPTEPPATDAAAVALLFKLPCGTRLERRFYRHHTLNDLYNYVYSNSKAPEEFEITTNFPKRVINCFGITDTLQNSGIKHRDVLFVNDCNA